MADKNGDNNETYSAPSYEVISADSLESSVALMSSGGGGGGGGGTVATYNEAYLVFSGIWLWEQLSPIDHAALIVKKTNGTGYFYSFAADVNEAVTAATIGTRGFLSTSVSSSTAVGDKERKPKILVSVSTFISSGKVWTDFINDRIGTYDQGYYRMIKIPISNATGTSLVSYADAFRQKCNDSDNNKEYGDYSGISTMYELFSHNCYDVATQLLGLLGYEVVYPKTAALTVLAALAIFITAANAIAGAAAVIFIAGLTVTDNLPNVPNCAYDDFQEVRRNGVKVSQVTLQSFRERA